MAWRTRPKRANFRGEGVGERKKYTLQMMESAEPTEGANFTAGGELSKDESEAGRRGTQAKAWRKSSPPKFPGYRIHSVAVFFGACVQKGRGCWSNRGTARGEIFFRKSTTSELPHFICVYIDKSTARGGGGCSKERSVRGLENFFFYFTFRGGFVYTTC